jgi:hypothetical protein
MGLKRARQAPRRPRLQAATCAAMCGSPPEQATRVAAPPRSHRSAVAPPHATPRLHTSAASRCSTWTSLRARWRRWRRAARCGRRSRRSTPGCASAALRSSVGALGGQCRAGRITPPAAARARCQLLLLWRGQQTRHGAAAGCPRLPQHAALRVTPLAAHPNHPPRTMQARSRRCSRRCPSPPVQSSPLCRHSSGRRQPMPPRRSPPAAGAAAAAVAPQWRRPASSHSRTARPRPWRLQRPRWQPKRSGACGTKG